MNSRRVSSFPVGVLLCFLSMASLCPSTAAGEDPLRHGYAFIIGTWRYDDARWSRLDDISYQLEQLRNSLKLHFDAVQVLPNPTFAQLDAGLREFLRIRGNDENARLFVYYAGHGYTELDLHRNEYRGYITGSDTPYVDGSAQSFAEAWLKSISMEDVRGMVSAVNALQVLFVFDSCFAGTVFTARSPASQAERLSENDVARLMMLPVREFITAGDIHERIPAHSPVPQLLINALGGAADPYGLGVITAQQIQQVPMGSDTRNRDLPTRGETPRRVFRPRRVPIWYSPF